MDYIYLALYNSHSWRRSVTEFESVAAFEMIFSTDVVSKGAAFFFNLIFMYVGKKETPLGNDIWFLIGVFLF